METGRTGEMGKEVLTEQMWAEARSEHKVGHGDIRGWLGVPGKRNG